MPLPLDAELYKWRHLIENFFCKLKEFKRIAMRADKTDQSFTAIWLGSQNVNQSGRRKIFGVRGESRYLNFAVSLRDCRVCALADCE